jgi:EAL domain-containing protein (putative c-di-GMP-specific phosphodiesterase class I)
MDDKPLLVVFDDEVVIADLIGEIAQHEGFAVEVTTGRAAFERALARAPDVIVVDLQMPDLDGVETLRLLAQRDVRSGIVLVSGVDERTLASAERFGIDQGLSMIGTLAKPFVPDELNELLAFAQLSTRALTATDLQRATQNDELEVHYLPALAREHGGWRVESVEALLRWNHPVRGWLTPEEFLHLGQDPQIDRAVTDFVVQRGLQPLEGWRDAGVDLGLRVNVGLTSLGEEAFPDRLLTWLDEHGLPASQLMLEIDERALLTRDPTSVDVLTRLRLKGFKLALDNFGVGLSSLTQLFDVSFNEVKIDKSLLLRAPVSVDVRVRIDALVGLAHKLGLKACAEGLDHEEGLAFLESIGCDAAQGVHVSPPLPASRVPAFVRAWENRRLSRQVS